MKNKTIERFAHNLAKEISDRPSFDIAEIETLIAVRVQSVMFEIMNQHALNEEKEYLALLNEQSQYKAGSEKYNKTAYKLSIAKSKKAIANRAANNVGRDDNFSKMKIFLISKNRKDLLDEFLDEMKNKVVQASSSDQILSAI